VSGVPIDRALSKRGLASRSEARTLLREGRVLVNGRVVRHVNVRVNPTDVIAVNRQNGERTVEALCDEPSSILILLNKPRGVMTTHRDPEGRRTVFDVLAEAGMTERLIAVGRLDFASTGLLLLTNDNALANALTDPASAIPRQYAVTVRGRVSDEAARQLPADVHVRKASARETHLIVTLTRGRNREIRKMFESIGHEVTRLHRFAYGPYALGPLQPGHWRSEAVRAFSYSGER
jgi:23S rRNA pseudouridine2605 synthase